MAFTSHGHHIPATVLEGRPKSVARCGGPGLCKTCTQEWSQADRRAMEERYGKPYSPPEGP